MPQQQSPSPATPNPDTTFVPRKEFIRDQKPPPSSFAIVAISSSNLVRLYSFPPHVVIALRILFESSTYLLAFREDLHQHLCEFSLNGKPWASPKNVMSEKLLIDILAVIYQCGYTYLSSLDYGRESDDRLAMAFSKPSIPPPANSSRSATPLPSNTSPFRDSSASSNSERNRPKRTPFALSFLSPTLMRVIAPPLHLTPAILQAVRASWPRGVVSEKKVGENSFEFKLKGYKWFQQDTFATDSLRHILSLLTSLDSHSFTLLSSISLTNRSRVKDLWVFTGPGSSSVDESTSQESVTGHDVNGDTNRLETVGHYVPSLAGPLHQHRRLTSEPTRPSSHAPQHARTATEQGNFALTRGYRTDHPTMGPALLRKPAPRAQVPVSVIHEADPPGTAGIRAYLPSTISSSVDDMTGVGANGFPPTSFHNPSPLEQYEMPAGSVLPTPVPSPPKSSLHPRPRSPLRPVATRQKTPPLLTSSPAHSPTTPLTHHGRQESGVGLLGAGAFRDSSVSNASDASFDIPIQWTGIDPIAQRKDSKGASQGTFPPGSASPRRASSVGPMLPGGWRPTPVEEKPEVTVAGGVVDEQPEKSTPPGKNEGNKTPIHEVTSRITSPELTRPDMPLRKSEAALVGLITNTHPPPIPTVTRAGTSGSETPSSGHGQGWVLVNVGESKPGSQVGPNEPTAAATPFAPGSSEHAAPGPQAKAIVIMDAIENKNKKKDKPEATSPFKKRLLSLGRKNSVKGRSPEAQTQPSDSKMGPGLRDRFRLIGASEASGKERKRGSIN
ncbi:hypothetical protein H0H87_011031 [Tephrocybe sp. NHM501043]|nr:hypothetical protein H0H87_011031 [Tephrocybe sp. NHM501043]